MDYWHECISASFEEAGIIATDDQIKQVAKFVDISNQNFGTAHGYDCIPNPARAEADRLSRLLEEEKSKVFCKECNGKGRVILHGPIHSSDSICWECNGNGKYTP